MNLWNRALVAIVCLGGAACHGGAPAEGRPWFVRLAEAGSAAQADKLASLLSDQLPDELAGAHRLSIEDRGFARHWVVSRGLESEPEARSLAAILDQAPARKLPIQDWRTLEPITEPGQALEIALPDDLEILEGLAAQIPAPERVPDLALRSLWLAPRAASSGPLQPLSCARWLTRLGALGFPSLAHATYRLGKEPGGGQATVFVGRIPEGKPPAGVARALWQKFYPAMKTVRAARASYRGDNPFAALGWFQRQQALAVDPPLPDPQPAKLPWGPGQVYPFTFLGRAAHGRSRTEWQARLAVTPEPAHVFLVVADAAAASWIDLLLAPIALDEPSGIRFTPELLLFFTTIPEGGPGGEVLSSLRMDRLGECREAQTVNRDGWVKAHADWEVRSAGFESEAGAWQVTWIETAGPAEAQATYERLLLNPRNERLSALFGGKNRVDYDIGVEMKELDSAKGWLLHGAEQGTLHELYFPKGARAFLLQAPQRKGKGLSPQDLVDRAELLP